MKGDLVQGVKRSRGRVSSERTLMTMYLMSDDLESCRAFLHATSVSVTRGEVQMIELIRYDRL